MLTIKQSSAHLAPQIAPLIYDAIGDIAHHLTNETSKQDVLQGLERLIVATDNRHSYLNTFVALDDEKVMGIVVLYDGKNGKKLDAKLSEKLSYNIEFEAHDDEYYIDTLCVHADARGQGIGTQLLQFAEQQGHQLGFHKLSLNVELAKEQARKLYESQGFVVTENWMINGEQFYHMVKTI